MADTIVAVLRQWRDREHAENFILSRNEVIVLIEEIERLRTLSGLVSDDEKTAR